MKLLLNNNDKCQLYTVTTICNTSLLLESGAHISREMVEKLLIIRMINKCTVQNIHLNITYLCFVHALRPSCPPTFAHAHVSIYRVWEGMLKTVVVHSVQQLVEGVFQVVLMFIFRRSQPTKGRTGGPRHTGTCHDTGRGHVGGGTNIVTASYHSCPTVGRYYSSTATTFLTAVPHDKQNVNIAP